MGIGVHRERERTGKVAALKAAAPRTVLPTQHGASLTTQPCMHGGTVIATCCVLRVVHITTLLLPPNPAFSLLFSPHLPSCQVEDISWDMVGGWTGLGGSKLGTKR